MVKSSAIAPLSILITSGSTDLLLEFPVAWTCGLAMAHNNFRWPEALQFTIQ
jgi:hypothetical protein